MSEDSWAGYKDSKGVTFAKTPEQREEFYREVWASGMRYQKQAQEYKKLLKRFMKTYEDEGMHLSNHEIIYAFEKEIKDAKEILEE